jgi:hypothetical protein
MDLLDSLDKIIPVLVFFFWVIISIFSQSKNKKRTQKTNQNPSTPKTQYRRPVSSAPPSPYEKPETTKEEKSPTFDDLKKKLETIFSESLPGDYEPEEYKNEEKQQSDTVSTEKQTISETTQQETSVVEVAAPLSVKNEKKKWNSDDGINAYTQEAESSAQKPVIIDLSIEKIREGIILSEILAPPVSLRQDTF